jgi:hypothetical protein
MNEIILYSKRVVKRESSKKIDGKPDLAIIENDEDQQNHFSSTDHEAGGVKTRRKEFLFPHRFQPSPFSSLTGTRDEERFDQDKTLPLFRPP